MYTHIYTYMSTSYENIYWDSIGQRHDKISVLEVQTPSSRVLGPSDPIMELLESCGY